MSIQEVRFICSKDNPWTKDKGKAIHPNAKYLKDKDYGDGECTECFKCLDCGLYFEVEIAQ